VGGEQVGRILVNYQKKIKFFSFSVKQNAYFTPYIVNKLLEVIMKKLQFLLVFVLALSGCAVSEPGTTVTKIWQRSAV